MKQQVPVFFGKKGLITKVVVVDQVYLKSQTRGIFPNPKPKYLEISKPEFKNWCKMANLGIFKLKTC